MAGFRTGIAHSGRWPAFVLLIAALAARLLVPAGFMPMATAHGVRLVLCSGHGPMAMPGGHGDPTHHGGDQPCGFSALGDAATGGGDFAVLALVVAFFTARRQITRRNAPLRLPARLRPPLRAPPPTTFA